MFLQDSLKMHWFLEVKGLDFLYADHREPCRFPTSCGSKISARSKSEARFKRLDNSFQVRRRQRKLSPPLNSTLGSPTQNSLWKMCCLNDQYSKTWDSTCFSTAGLSTEPCLCHATHLFSSLNLIIASLLTSSNGNGIWMMSIPCLCATPARNACNTHLIPISFTSFELCRKNIYSAG